MGHMSDSAPANANRSTPTRGGGERPINLILPIVTAIVGFVIGFLLSDISSNLAARPELPVPKGISNAPNTPGERDARPTEDEAPAEDAPADEAEPTDEEAPADDAASPR